MRLRASARLASTTERCVADCEHPFTNCRSILISLNGSLCSFERPDWPVPKSSMESVNPLSRSRVATSINRTASRATWVSVSSSVMQSGSTRCSRHIAFTRSGRSSRSKARAERLIATRSSRPALRHRPTHVIDSRSENSVRDALRSSERSINGTNDPGWRSPSAGCFHRTSDSTPANFPVRSQSFGW